MKTRLDKVEAHCNDPIWQEWMNAKFEKQDAEDDYDKVVSKIEQLEEKKVDLKKTIEKATVKTDAARDKTRNSKAYKAWLKKQDEGQTPFKRFNKLNAKWQEAVDKLEEAKALMEVKKEKEREVKRKAKKEAGKKAKEDKKKAQEEAKKLQKAADENQKIELDKKIEELMKQKKEIGAPKKVSLPNCQYCNCRVTVCNARKTKVFGEAGNAMMTVEEYVESLADGPEKEAMKLASMCKRQNGGRKRKSSEDSPQASPQISEAPGPEPAPKATEIDMKAAEQLEASAHPTTGGKNLGDLASIAGEAAAEDSSEDDSDSSESEESDSDDE